MDATQPLVIGVGDQLQNQFIINGDESIDGVIDDFMESHGGGWEGFVNSRPKFGQNYKPWRINLSLRRAAFLRPKPLSI